MLDKFAIIVALRYFRAKKNEKFVKLQINAKDNHITREQIKAEKLQFINELTEGANDVLSELMNAQNKVLVTA